MQNRVQELYQGVALQCLKKKQKKIENKIWTQPNYDTPAYEFIKQKQQAHEILQQAHTIQIIATGQ
jgi:5,10-methylenetetrahydrofolate reductase